MATQQVQANSTDSISSLVLVVAGDDRTKHVCVEVDDTASNIYIMSALHKAVAAVTEWISTRSTNL